ncbi:MAG: beta-hydroxyacyl-ACP dehydratase [bacterium]|nr:beta-hydroxyacyl-ACP dehydratase [bacterium]
MQFSQIDRVTLLEPGVRIEATKTVQGTEDYLKDHFPRFPVMPGVLMLEALYQASALLVRATEEHRVGLVVLRTAKNVKFADFVQPGETLNIVAEILKKDGSSYTLKAQGTKGDSIAVAGRLVVDCVEDDGQPEIVAKHAARYMKQLTAELTQTSALCE